MADLLKKLLADSSVNAMVGTERVVEEDDPKKFRKKLERYMDSANQAAGGQLWPLVKQAKIRSRKWDLLKTGCVLVDAPGVNDSNSTRDAIVKRHLKNADSIWIVSNINRAVNDKTAKDMLNKTFQRQLMMDGKMSDSMVFVATQSDVLSTPEVVRSLGLPESATVLDCARARNRFTAARIQRDFIDGLMEMAERAGDTVDRASFAQRFKLPTFCVSSMDYQLLSGLRSAADGAASAFADTADTQIPALQRHVLAATLSQRTRKIRRHADQLQQFGDSLATFAEGMPGIKRPQREAAMEAWTSCKFELEKQAGNRLSEFRKAMLDEFTGSLIPSLKQGAIESADQALETAGGWGSSCAQGGGAMHWATYKAHCRRNGTWRRNMSEELTVPILESVSTRWERVFVSELDKHLAALNVGNRTDVKAFQTGMRAALVAAKLDDTGFSWRHLQSLATSGVQAKIGEIKEKVSATQRELSRSITPFVQQKMTPTYLSAFAEAGTGSHRRRCHVIEAYVDDNRTHLFGDAIEPIKTQLVPLLKELVKMIEAAEKAYIREFEVLVGVFWEVFRGLSLILAVVPRCFHPCAAATRRVPCSRLGVHAHRLLTGTCNPMPCIIRVLRCRATRPRRLGLCSRARSARPSAASPPPSRSSTPVPSPPPSERRLVGCGGTVTDKQRQAKKTSASSKQE